MASVLALVLELVLHPRELDIAHLLAFEPEDPRQELGLGLLVHIQAPTPFHRQPQSRGELALFLEPPRHPLVLDTARSLALDIANSQAVEPDARRERELGLEFGLESDTGQLLVLVLESDEGLDMTHSVELELVLWVLASAQWSLIMLVWA